MPALDDAILALKNIIDHELSIARYENATPKNNIAACLDYLVKNLEGHTRLTTTYVDERYKEIGHVFHDGDYNFSNRDDIKAKVDTIMNQLRQSLNQGQDMNIPILNTFDRVKQESSTKPPVTHWPSKEEIQKAKKRSEEAYPEKAPSKRRITSRANRNDPPQQKSKPSI